MTFVKSYCFLFAFAFNSILAFACLLNLFHSVFHVASNKFPHLFFLFAFSFISVFSSFIIFRFICNARQTIHVNCKAIHSVKLFQRHAARFTYTLDTDAVFSTEFLFDWVPLHWFLLPFNEYSVRHAHNSAWFGQPHRNCWSDKSKTQSNWNQFNLKFVFQFGAKIA